MKLHHVILAAALMAIVVAAAAYASPAPPDQRDRQAVARVRPATSAKTIEATLFYTGLTTIDSDHDGKPSVGDVAVSPGFFVDGAGKRAGRIHASCLLVNAAGTEYNCTDYTHFAGGDIITAGRFSPLEKSNLGAIIGGTGAYAGMRGTVLTRWLAKDFSKAQVTFTLQP